MTILASQTSLWLLPQLGLQNDWVKRVFKQLICDTAHMQQLRMCSKIESVYIGHCEMSKSEHRQGTLFYTSFIYNVISKFRSVGSTFSSIGPRRTDAIWNPSS